MPETAAPPRRSSSAWPILFGGIIVTLAFFALLSFFSEEKEPVPEIAFGQLVEDAKAGRVESIVVRGEAITATYVSDGGDPVVKESRLAENVDIVAVLRGEGIALSRAAAPAGGAGVDLEFEENSSSGWSTALTIGLNVVPLLLFGVIIWFFFKQSNRAGSQAGAFGKSHARLVTGGKITVTFDDVAGVDEAKQELTEVVEFLKYPAKFAALGARIPKGILLLGPPGTGKTLLARAVAGEAGVAFFSISGSEFVEMYVGVGASRVRDLFEQAKSNAPCIVFLDEIDAVGRQRGTGLGGSHDEREQTLNQILTEMDGFEAGTNVVVIAATNRPDILDPALVRPGRFDRKVVLDAPDVRGREAILKVHVKGKPLDADVSVEKVARTTPGFTGADLANLVNEAAILAARRDKTVIGMTDFEEAVDRVLAGPERKSRLLSAEERRLTAYHEGGHVVVAHFTAKGERPHKVTIVSRGVAAGYTRFLPAEESHFRTPEMLQDQLCAAMGGHAAEELVFGTASTGPSNDLEQVGRIARAMVKRWGMSARIGPVTFGKTEELVFLGREISETRDYSEETARIIDEEVRALIVQAAARAKAILVEHRDLLDHLAATLLEVETLQGEDLARVLGPGADAEAAGAAPPMAAMRLDAS
ncbi:MAG: ATP-dependent zinc metalloprotease FtsH [Thermoflexaceae bacterium]|nr:ATP-dependent zinc metalloprotease FtsH [Thermoflexaceae bacterium]